MQQNAHVINQEGGAQNHANAKDVKIHAGKSPRLVDQRQAKNVPGRDMTPMNMNLGAGRQPNLCIKLAKT